MRTNEQAIRSGATLLTKRKTGLVYRFKPTSERARRLFLKVSNHLDVEPGCRRPMLNESCPLIMPKRLLASFSFLAAMAVASAAPLFDEPIPELHLTNGEVLHQVVAKGFNSTSVLVRYSDGAKTVPYDLFPPEYKSLVLARKPVPHVSAPAKTTSADSKVEVKTAEKKKKAERPDRLVGDRQNGLTLTSFTAGAGTGYMNVEIYNDNTDSVELSPNSFQAELDNGKTVQGRHWIDTDEEGNINNTLAASQELPARSTTALKVSFTVPPGVSVQKVSWVPAQAQAQN
jgi:hypothetical protein